MRYRVTSPWSSDSRFGNFIVQSADIVDTKNGREYSEGAFRVVDGRTGKPVKGKGGVTPFFGETAWSDAERLASDLAMKEAFAR